MTSPGPLGMDQRLRPAAARPSQRGDGKSCLPVAPGMRPKPVFVRFAPSANAGPCSKVKHGFTCAVGIVRRKTQRLAQRAFGFIRRPDSRKEIAKRGRPPQNTVLQQCRGDSLRPRRKGAEHDTGDAEDEEGRRAECGS